MLVVALIDGIEFSYESPFHLIQASLTIGLAQNLDFEGILTERPHVLIERPIVPTDPHFSPVLTPARFYRASRLADIAFPVDFVSKQIDKHCVRLSRLR
ncbi:MAG TPA: hypothetical protein VE866_02890 [Candidatus Binatia bacterium]|nr:hypothetical protein [Candidatus Binatia bacterium]